MVSTPVHEVMSEKSRLCWQSLYRDVVSSNAQILVLERVAV